jgi:type II secretory pathway pseudopilin PulG
MARGERTRRGARGFTYLGLLVLVALIGVMLAAAGNVAATSARREREAQLLWVGHEYRAAIGRYFRQRRAYPQSLQELLGSAPDAPVQVRYLRRLYPDPMTNAMDWVLVQAPNGGIMGVASTSTRAPLKTANFDDADKDFAGAKAYGDWQFTYPPRVVPAATPGANPPPPAAARPGPTRPDAPRLPGVRPGR